MRGRHLVNKYLILNLMVTLQWDHNFCCIIVDFEPLGTNEKNFVSCSRLANVLTIFWLNYSIFRSESSSRTAMYRKRNYPNRKWNYFSHFQASDGKTSFTNCFSFDLRGSKMIFITGNGIIQTGNGVIYPTSRPLFKKHLLQNVSHLIQGVQFNFQNRKWKYPNRK